MNKFKISASKGQKKYSLVLTAVSEDEAKDRIHSEWYSILWIEKIDAAEILWNKFVFGGKVNEKNKKWTIIWKDIFKVYMKLRDDLWYTLDFLYPENDLDISQDEKDKILHDLEEGYNHVNKWKKEIEKPWKNKFSKEKKSLEGFYMKKDLDETYALIETVLEKLQKLIINPKVKINETKKQKLTEVYNAIIKIKKSTNIEKLKQVWEMALLKIWDIELESLEWSKTEESKKLLSETNKLLKQVGSSTQFKEKNKDIWYLFSLFLSDLKEKILFLKKIKKNLTEKSEKKLIDKDSYSFLKTLLLLDKYKERLKENNKE